MRHLVKFNESVKTEISNPQSELIRENTSEKFYIDKKTKELIPDDGI